MLTEFGTIQIDGEVEFLSGEKKNFTDRPGIWFDWGLTSELGVNYSRIFDVVVAGVRNQKKKDLVSRANNVEIDLEITVDQEEGTIKAKVAYEELDFWGSVKALKKVNRKVELEMDFNDLGPHHVKVGDFYMASGRLKERVFFDRIKSYDKEINELSGAVVELRYLAAVANYFNGLKQKGFDVSMPKIAPMDERVTMAERLINPNLVGKVEDGEIVGNDVLATIHRNLYAITGPNNNGKTIYGNSVGLAQAKAQAGWMVLSPDAKFSPKDNIYCHRVRPGDLEVGESRYTHGLSRIREIFESASPDSLILIDEMCTGTPPKDGRKQVNTVFRALGKLGATAYVATHFHELSDVAEELAYAGNLHSVAENGGPEITFTYAIADGASTLSSGPYLARQIGVDENGLNFILDERFGGENTSLR